MSNARNLANLLANGSSPAGDTAAGDDAAIGYTAAEGLILTGQGSTNDVTIKNDADADVIEIPTGTTNVTVAGTLGTGGLITSGAGITGAGLLTTGGNIIIPDAGNIGSASDTDAMAISSGGVVTFSQAPIGTGMRLLLNATISSAVAQYDISSTYINSTYDSYKLIFNLLPATDNVDLHALFFVSGSVVTDSHYGYNTLAMYSAEVVTNTNAAAFIELNNQGAGNAAGEGVCGFGELTNVNSTISRTSLSGIVSVASNGALPKASVYNGMFLPAQRANVVNGLRLKFSSGNIASGTVQIYGISK
jgi:hypothetical protein